MLTSTVCRGMLVVRSRKEEHMYEKMDIVFSGACFADFIEPARACGRVGGAGTAKAPVTVYGGVYALRRRADFPGHLLRDRAAGRHSDRAGGLPRTRQGAGCVSERGNGRIKAEKERSFSALAMFKDSCLTDARAVAGLPWRFHRRAELAQRFRSFYNRR